MHSIRSRKTILSSLTTGPRSESRVRAATSADQDFWYNSLYNKHSPTIEMGQLAFMGYQATVFA